MAIKGNKEERIENVEIDINDTSLADGTAQEIDLKEDWQAKAAPPPKGRYKFKLFIEDDKFEMGTMRGFAANDPNGKFYKKAITCKIQDPTGKWQDSMIFYSVSTGMPRGKKISSMAGFLRDLKVKVPNSCSGLYLARLLVKAFAKLDGPVLIGDCDWSAWDKNSEKGGDFGAAARVGMLNFPKLADGTYSHIVTNKAGEECLAKLKVLKWIVPVATTAPAGATAVAGAKPVVSQPKPQAKPVEAIVEEVVEESGGVVLSDDGEVVFDA